jgi:hypothetical protein
MKPVNSYVSVYILVTSFFMMFCTLCFYFPDFHFLCWIHSKCCSILYTSSFELKCLYNKQECPWQITYCQSLICENRMHHENVSIGYDRRGCMKCVIVPYTSPLNTHNCWCWLVEAACFSSVVKYLQFVLLVISFCIMDLIYFPFTVLKWA